VVVPEEAEIVKRIFREYLEGASLQQIANGLEADGKVTGAGKTTWPPNSLRNILQNEKYIGDALLAKTYTVDFLSKKRVINTGEVPQYYVENSHQGIIPRDIFMQTQEELARRANLRNRKNGGKRVYSAKYALSSIVFCGECEDIYRRVHWNNRGKRSIVWRCVNRLEERGSDCFSPTIAETDLHDVVMQAINQTLTDKGKFCDILQQNIMAVLDLPDEETIAIDARLEELQRELIRLSNNHAAHDVVVDDIIRLQEQKHEALMKAGERETQRQRIGEMMEFLREQGNQLLEYDDTLTRRLVERVTIWENRFMVTFKSGLEIEI
jgi:uncharacterized protein YlxP (DUF503 family)